MASKQSIIDDIGRYSPAEIASFIRRGIVSFNELATGEAAEDFSVSARREVQRLLESSEISDWEKALSENTEEAYLAFLQTYPQSTRAGEASQKINELKEQIRQKEFLEEQRKQQAIWDTVDKDSIDDLQRFVNEHPNDPSCVEARKKINTLRKESFLWRGIETLKAKINDIQTDKTVTDVAFESASEIERYIDNGRITTSDVQEILRQDRNFLKAKSLQKLINDGYLNYSDLMEAGIDDLFIEALVQGYTPQRFEIPNSLNSISKVSTEVYFWGIPSSGKTCALGAIMSVAGNGTVARSMVKNNDCQGYGYMMRLSTLFNNKRKVGVLPEGTSVDATYEMGFDLEDEQGKRHPITCIDLAGELMRCMYKNDAGEWMSDKESQVLATLTHVLGDNRTGNRKVHFFVLEYGGEDREYEGLRQESYLEGALRYIERTQIFKADTDAIYLMLSKVDKTGLKGLQLVNELKRYIDENYRGFYQGLQSICQKHQINGGEVECIPFTLGEVCFQDYCLFESKTAENVVRILLNRTKGFKTGRQAQFFGIFKK